MKIAIAGSRGIPNQYGGFEQLAQELSVGLVQMGHHVTVYNIHNHNWQQGNYKGVTIVHCYAGPNWMGTAGQFLYDLNSIRHIRRNQFDVVLMLGYTSSSIWGWLYPRNTKVVCNMDGLEWKRGKYHKWVQRFLHWAERLAVRYSNSFVADSPALQQYLQERYKITSCCIAYGAVIPQGVVTALPHHLAAGQYCLLIARMEPENNIEMIVEGFCQSQTTQQLVIVGNTANRLGRRLQAATKNDKRVLYVGAIYDTAVLHCLRSQCHLYFHGHSVGGTNPSLLEAMASGACIAAHQNVFNEAVLGPDARYFSNPGEVTEIITQSIKEDIRKIYHDNNLQKIQTQYNWPLIIEAYESYIKTLV